ncbi:MAG: copper homeostasis protein CutC [Catonella sp.]|uniref:copper homeostasis protein CutC n=1 Tax=Catonella sp. TaxID=2382125 RepID=UPI003F9F732F
MRDYILECCVDRLSSAINGEKGGATRFELCANLIIGGTTPSLTLFRQVRENTNLPIHVLIRNRFGDFCYTDSEIEEMCDSIKGFVEAGADGVVVGALTPEGALDEVSMEKFMEAAKGRKTVLHRAFDMCKEPFVTLEKSKKIGIDTILTSGQKGNCMEGSMLIKELIERGGKDINILIGAGVSAEVIKGVFEVTGGKNYHMSGKKVIDSRMSYRKKEVSMGLSSLSEYDIWETSEQEIKKAVQVLREL